MENGLWNAVYNNQGKRIAIFTHATAMAFLLMRWCKLNYINEDNKINLEFNNKVIFDKVFDAPEVFKLIIENDEIKSIENLKFYY